MTQPATAAVVSLDDLEIGDLLAEGGEGRVFLLPRLPHLVYKAYRRPVRSSHLEELVGWPRALDPSSQAIVAAASAWPSALVVDRSGRSSGLLMSRAPRRFSVRHRDGNSHLASLSYLTADPAHRAVAYGIDLPPAASAQRVGLVYALARLLAVFESSPRPVAHGDLSTKNVLWSLTRGPEIFVIDCDSCEVGGNRIRDEAGSDRRRAMTPNWNDPAVAAGANPSPESDLYSLALVFLRVVGAANFPIQARQREGGPVRVEVAVPQGPGSAALLDPEAPVWRICESGLRADDPALRPRAGEWTTVLEGLLVGMGAASFVESVASAQGWAGSPPPVVSDGRVSEAADGAGVSIVPIAAGRKAVNRWTRVSPAPPKPSRSNVPAAAGTAQSAAGGLRTYQAAGATRATPGPIPAAVAKPQAANAPIWPEAAANARRAAAQWADKHRRAVTALAVSDGRARAARTLALCAVVDVMGLFLLVFFVGILLAPLLGL